MRKSTVIKPVVFLIILLLFTLASSLLFLAETAPIPKTGPLTLEGTIEDVQWSPVLTHKAMPGMSGTLAQERTFPARYRVILRDITIVEALGGYGISVDVDGRVATLLLNHPSDDQFLKKGLRIRVVGYEESGDEGGTWSKHVSIEVLK